MLYFIFLYTELTQCKASMQRLLSLPPWLVIEVHMVQDGANEQHDGQITRLFSPEACADKVSKLVTSI
jgi:hypothetical protein